MTRTLKSFTLAFAILLSGCGGGGSDRDTSHAVSTGLKIFLTSEVHNGDFANDPTLTGATAIQKADAFCTKSAAKPSTHTYKALIVDGVLRDAVTSTDWVLRPNTSYYQVNDNVLIDVTTAGAVFAATFRNMPNAVRPTCPTCTAQGAWTGIDNGATFATGPRNCSRWGQGGAIAGQLGTHGNPETSGGLAFYSAGSSADCVSVQTGLYCVQQ